MIASRIIGCAIDVHRELGPVAELAPVFVLQLHTYLKLANKNPGLLINFNVPVVKDGIKRVVNHL